MNTHETELQGSFLLFEAAYGPKWSGGNAALWAVLLEDATVEEIRAATKAWCKAQPWPPTPRDLLQTIPRFCRCGKCWPCHHRAVERAGKALERGAIGADFNAPERLTPASGLPARPALPEAGE